MTDNPAQNAPSSPDGAPQSKVDPQALPPPGSVAERADSLFLGPEGIYWIWRLLAYIVMRKAFYWVLGDAVLYAQESRISPLWIYLISESVFFVAAVSPALLMTRLERRPFGAYGLPLRQAFGKLFWVGALWGIAAVTLLVLTIDGAGAFDFGRLALHGERIFKFAVFWGVFFLIVGLAEEFFLRGYLQFTLSEGIGFWPAALVLSIAFAALHFRNQGETPIGLAAAGVIGLFFCLTLRRTGTLWFAVGFHTTWDWGESYLYSVPDSGTVMPGHLLKSSFHGPAWLTGGSVGPEGSVMLFVLVALLWIAFDRLYPEVKYGQAVGTRGGGPPRQPDPGEPHQPESTYHE